MVGDKKREVTSNVVGIGLHTYFSIQHVQAAAYFSRQTAASEALVEQGDDSEFLRVAIRANAASAIFMSAAFLEALANELFADALKTSGGHLDSISDNGRSLIAELAGDDTVEKCHVLTKFNLLLKAEGKEPLNLGEFPGQDVVAMIKLRNSLVHYKASWLDVGTPGMVRSGNLRESKLQKAIDGKFPHRAGANPTSGDAWLGYGCAKWCVQSSIALTDKFFHEFGITPLYEHVRSNLALE